MIATAEIPWAPWLDEPLHGLRARGDNLPHAILLHGAPGTGKTMLARRFATDLLCEQAGRLDAQSAACGVCSGCRWMASNAHPDFRHVRPEALDPDFVAERGRKPSVEIKIDAMRSLGEFLTVTGHRGGWRIVIISPAEAMNVFAANALLKMLEEPGPRTLFMLVASVAAQVPATVRSRCQSIHIATPDREVIRRWLLEHDAKAGQAVDRVISTFGAPLHSLAGIEPSRHAAHQALLAAIEGLPDTASSAVVDVIAGLTDVDWIDILQRWLSDLARVKAGSDATYFPYSMDRLSQLAGRVHWQALFAQHDRLLKARAQRDHPLNVRLFCESVILAYQQAFDA